MLALLGSAQGPFCKNLLFLLFFIAIYQIQVKKKDVLNSIFTSILQNSAPSSFLGLILSVMTAFYLYQSINQQSFQAPSAIKNQYFDLKISGYDMCIQGNNLIQVSIGIVGGRNPPPYPFTTKNHPSKKGLRDNCDFRVYLVLAST